jgi:hypothetical protein
MPDEIESTSAEPSLVDRVCNRHFARLYCNLEDAGCNKIYLEAIKVELKWLRSDLNVLWKNPGRPADVDGNGP